MLSLAKALLDALLRGHDRQGLTARCGHPTSAQQRRAPSGERRAFGVRPRQRAERRRRRRVVFDGWRGWRLCVLRAGCKLTYGYNYVADQRFKVQSDKSIPEGDHIFSFEFKPTGNADIAKGKACPRR
jgi:hypothetical protein